MKRILLLIVLTSGNAIAQKQFPTIQQQVWSLTEVMYHDVANPPAAARFYAYALLAGYETLSQLDDTVLQFQKKLNAYPAITVPFDRSKIDTPLAVLYSIIETGKAILPSGYLLEEKQQELLNAFTDLSKEKVNASVSFAKTIAQKIVQYSKTDGYFKLSTLSRYKPLEGEGYWQPTPPEYMAAVEPNWNTIRTFFLDSPQQCMSKKMLPFDKQPASSFYQLANEVYATSRSLTGEQKLIASFWDCNPFAVQNDGHLQIGIKKISPGAHWMGIAGIACKKTNISFEKTMEVYAILSTTLMDAFICCWDEKYRSNRIRPETVIRKYIDPDWQPLLQTPPFPEYLSGHSVISTASAEVLSHFFGDNFSFRDSTERAFGLPDRNFTSFRQAASEAAISRFYGGIHFTDAIVNGQKAGERVGKFILKKLS